MGENLFVGINENFWHSIGNISYRFSIRESLSLPVSWTLRFGKRTVLPADKLLGCRCVRCVQSIVGEHEQLQQRLLFKRTVGSQSSTSVWNRLLSMTGCPMLGLGRWQVTVKRGELPMGSEFPLKYPFFLSFSEDFASFYWVHMS